MENKPDKKKKQFNRGSRTRETIEVNPTLRTLTKAEWMEEVRAAKTGQSDK